jgi:hypothetical protein
MSDDTRYNQKVEQARQDEVKRTRKAAEKLIGRIRERMRIDDVTLAGNAKWRGITQVCSTAAGAVRTGTTFQKRKEIQTALDQASMDVYLLYAQGVLDGREAVVVNMLIHNARQRLAYSPPTDFASGIYRSSVEPSAMLHVWYAVLGRRYDQDTPSGESFRREILQLLKQSLETDIRLLDSNHMPTYCWEGEPDNFTKGAKAMKARLTRVKAKLAEEKG